MPKNPIVVAIEQLTPATTAIIVCLGGPETIVLPTMPCMVWTQTKRTPVNSEGHEQRIVDLLYNKVH